MTRLVFTVSRVVSTGVWGWGWKPLKLPYLSSDVSQSEDVSGLFMGWGGGGGVHTDFPGVGVGTPRCFRISSHGKRGSR